MTEKITRADVERIKEKFILDNMLMEVCDVALLLGRSVKTVFRLIEEGELAKANGRNGSGRTMVPAWSVEKYRIKITTE